MKSKKIKNSLFKSTSHYASLFSSLLIFQSAKSATITWDAVDGSTAWFTATNWNPDTASSAWTTSDVAQFENAGTATTAGINMNTVNGAFSIGAIDITSARTRALTIGNSSSTNGTLTLNGATVNSIGDTVLRNASNSTLTLQNNETGTGNIMNIVLGNVTNNVIQITNTGGITIGSDVSGTDKKITLQGGGSGLLTLSGVNTYTGGTTVSTGGVVFTNKTSMPDTGDVALAVSTTLGIDVNTGNGWTTAGSGVGTLAGLFAGLGGQGTSTVTFAAGDSTLRLNVNSGGTSNNYSAVVSNAGATNLGIVKTGADTLTFSNSANTYTGATTIQQGTLSVASLANAGVASSLGAFATAGASGLRFSGGTLSYTGGSTTTDRGFTHNGNANSTLNIAGSNVALSLGSSTFNSNDNFTVSGATTNSLTVSSVHSAPTGAAQINFASTLPFTLESVTFASITGQFTFGNRAATTMTVGNITSPSSGQILFLAGVAGSVNIYNGIISGHTGTVIAGGGTQHFNNTGNTFSGLFEVRQATTVSFASIKDVGAGPSSLGAPASGDGRINFGQVTNAQTLRYTGTGDSTNRRLDLFGTTGTVTLEQAGTGLLKFTRDLTASGAGNKTLTLSGSTTGTGELAGAIVNNSNTGASNTRVTKAGSGTWTLSSTSNSYTGATTVNAGLLRINGSTHSSSAFTVAGGTLGGGGTVGGTVTVTSGAIAPGDGTNAIGTLKAGTTTVNLGSAFNFDLSTLGSTDLLDITGTFNKGSGSGTVVFNFMGTPSKNTDYTLVKWTTAPTSAFVAANFTFTGLDPQFVGVSNQFKIVGNSLQFTPVPEASNLLIGGLIGLGLMKRRRKNG